MAKRGPKPGFVVIPRWDIYQLFKQHGWEYVSSVYSLKEAWSAVKEMRVSTGLATRYEKKLERREK